MSLSVQASPTVRQTASFGQRVALYSRLAQTAFTAVLSLLLIGRYVWIFRHHPLQPDGLQPANGWFGWADQGAYYLAAHGWAEGNLDPLAHVYPAGYALLGALFVPIMPGQPFAVPNLLCWLASLWLFSALGVRLFPRMPGIRAISGLVFFLATVADLHAFYTWEIPWTSTPAAALTFASLVSALAPGSARRVRSACSAALLAGLIVLFRPTDAAVIVPAIGSFLLFSLWQRRPGGREAVRALGLIGGAFAVGPALLLATHMAIHGWSLGSYFENSRQIGFEWRLLPLRWVTLMLSPRPLYPAGSGFAEIYWYVLPGIAGILAAIFADHGRRAQHVLVGGGAVVFLCVYLCYRDLQVDGLFEFHNQHYFKWTLPVFGLYALGFVHLLAVRRRVVACSSAAVLVVMLSLWRPDLDVVPSNPASVVLADGSGLSLPHGLPDLHSAILAASPDDFLTLYFGQHSLETPGGPYLANSGFKIVPLPFGFMVVPLRPLPATPAVLHLAGPLRLDPAESVLSARQLIVFGLPCPITPQRAICRAFPVRLKAP